MEVPRMTLNSRQQNRLLVLSVAFSPDGHYVASGSSDNTAKVWDIPATSPLRQFVHKAAVNAVALSPDGKKLAGACKNATVKVWNTADGKEVLSLEGHAG